MEQKYYRSRNGVVALVVVEGASFKLATGAHIAALVGPSAVVELEDDTVAASIDLMEIEIVLRPRTKGLLKPEDDHKPSAPLPEEKPDAEEPPPPDINNKPDTDDKDEDL